jgi:hypothetical protein
MLVPNTLALMRMATSSNSDGFHVLRRVRISERRSAGFEIFENQARHPTGALIPVLTCGQKSRFKSSDLIIETIMLFRIYFRSMFGIV